MPHPAFHRRPLSRRYLFALALTLGLGIGCSSSTDEGDKNSADLVTTLTGPGQGMVGDVLSYSLEVRNDGPDAASQVVPTATLTGGLDFESASDGGTEAGGVITWPVIASLASGASQTLTFDVTVSAAGNATLAAVATSTTGDPKPGNNDGTASGSTVGVTGTAPPSTADLRVSMSGGLTGANGKTVTATITVTNDGPIAAQSVAVILTIPDAVTATVTSAEPATRASGQIVWALGPLAPNEVRALTVDIVIPATSSTALTARATSTTPDPKPSNNDGTATNANRSVQAVLVALRTITGEAAGDQFGWVTRNLGDLNGDGVADFASTAPTSNAGGALAGRAYVYSGKTGAELFRVTGNLANGQLGYSVDVIGDINADGTPDIAFGAPAINTALSGYVSVVSGKNGIEILRITGGAGVGFGFAVGRLGDFNGDGVPDLIVGVPAANGGAGGVSIRSGANGAALAFLAGVPAGGLLGVGLEGVGDINNDGIPDFAAGAMGEAGGGAIHLFSGADGSDLVPAFKPPTGGVILGNYWVNTPGDLDGDGTADIFGVDFQNGTNNSLRGAAYVFSGATGTLIRQFVGESPGDQFGIGRGVGDVTGDGKPDFILAAWRRSEGASQSGKIYLFDGANGALLRSFVSTTQGETLGFDAIGLGDVNGDGLTDYLVTGGQEINQGKAYIVAGVALP